MSAAPPRRTAWVRLLDRGAIRVLDVLAALFVLLVLGPLLLALGALIRFRMGSPVLFRQLRAGRDGVPFTIVKFRTMRDAFGPSGAPLPDAERLTPLGRFIRSTSMDELPQFWNVLRGEMSVVGPRPLPVAYLPLYSEEQGRRHQVRPGLTSWTAVNGRNAVSWEDQFRMDTWYVDHQSLWLDLKIMLLTVGHVLRREGVTQPGHATREPFRGSRSGRIAGAADALEEGL